MMRIFIFLALYLGVAIAPARTADFIMYVSGNNSLSAEASVLYNLIASHPTNSSNRVIVAIKTATANTFIVRGKGQSVTESLQDADYGMPDTLSLFLKKAEQYRSDPLSVLVLWGHGTSWYPENSNNHPTINRAIGRDALFGNALFFDQATEDKVFKTRYSLVVADACHYAATETIYAFRNTADIFIGSGHLIPADAFDYASIFATSATTADGIITAFFDAFHPYTAYSLSAVHIQSFCSAMRNLITSNSLSAIDRTSLLGIDGNDIYSTNTSDVDVYPLFDAPAWLLRHVSSEATLLGISLFFPPLYETLKNYFFDYYLLSFQKDTDHLSMLTHYFNKDEIAPFLERTPVIKHYHRTIRLTETAWYDTSTVTPSLLGVAQEYKVPLDYGITNNSGVAGFHSGYVTINTTDSVMFTHSTWHTQGFLTFKFSYILRFGDSLLLSYENNSGWHNYGSFTGRGSQTVFFPAGTLRVRFFVDGTITLPLYKGVEITTFLSTQITGEERLISAQSQNIPDFKYSSYYLILKDNHENITVTPLHPDTSYAKQILYYPNPTYDGILFFDTTYSHIDVFTSKGKKVMTARRVSMLDLSRFPKGLYYIKINNHILKVISL